MYINSIAILYLASVVTSIPLSSVQQPEQRDALAHAEADPLRQRSADSLASTDQSWDERISEYYSSALEKRRGGGGGSRGGGGSSSGGSSGSSSSSGGSRSGSGSSGSSSSGGTPSFGSTTAPKSFGSGSRYAGGATTPFKPGNRVTGIGAPVLFLGGAGLGLAAGAYAYGYYGYNYPNGYNNRNRTRSQNSTLPVQCFCQQYNPCGCGNNDNSTITEMLNDPKVAKVQKVNGTDTVLVNGTLPNGTTSDDTSAGLSLHESFAQQGGFLALGAVVFATVWGL